MAKKKQKILLIEDDYMQGMMYQTAFSQAGFEFLVFADSNEGIKSAAEQKPDLILLDLLLGKTSGLDVLKQLKADNKTKNIKVVVMTNYYREGLETECKKLGAIDFWTKSDFVPKEIVNKVKVVLA